jgi:hypothetical protein
VPASPVILVARRLYDDRDLAFQDRPSRAKVAENWAKAAVVCTLTA